MKLQNGNSKGRWVLSEKLKEGEVGLDSME